jgi:hypothetical protein
MQIFVYGDRSEALFSVLTIIYGEGWAHKATDLVMPPLTNLVMPMPNNEVSKP